MVCAKNVRNRTVVSGTLHHHGPEMKTKRMLKKRIFIETMRYGTP